MKTTCVIIDDEPNALNLMEGYILRTPSLDLRGKFFDALEAMEFLKEHKVDVIFTDINMPLLSGLELAGALPPEQRFIFTTAYQEHALNSFNYHVIDYLLKPITFSRFTTAEKKINGSDKQRAPIDVPGTNTIYVKSGGRFIRVNLDDIIYVKGEKEYASLHFANGRLLIYKRMKEMETLLPSNFKRVHLSYIVNTKRLDKIACKFVFIGAEKVPVSNTYRTGFHEFLNQQTL